MRPLDPRLVRTVRAVRTYLVVTVACGVALTGLILAQAWLVARTLAGATAGAGMPELATVVAAVGLVAVARAVLATGAETAALRSAATVKSQLRRRLVAHVTGGHPAAHDAGEIVTLATRGLDALDDYVARYLPQLVLAVLVPVAVLAVVARADWVSALVIALTLPLIPLFMALVGWHTQARTRRQWHLLQRLGGHFLDVVEGLPTLAVFRRARAQAALVRRATDAHREATMGTLRTAFLSALVLELLATLAVALVAVEVGLRLLYGRLDLETALLVLILTPEAYLPLREVGARFHASMEGVAAAEKVFAVLEAPGPAPAGPAAAAVAAGPAAAGPGRAAAVAGDRGGVDLPRGGPRPGTAAPGGCGPGSWGPGSPAPDRRDGVGILLDGVSVTYPGAAVPALDRVSLELPAGRTILVTGPSGAGKSTLLALLLGFVGPTAGRVAVTGDGRRMDLADLGLDRWRAQVAWLPQRPHLFDATVADNIRLGAPDATDADVRRAAEHAGAHDVIAALPEGYRTRLGERGTRLSSGQRQRVALARAFLRRLQGAPIVLLDEPTAHLDPENAAAVRDGVARLLDGGTGVVVAHDGGWEGRTDRTVHVDGGLVTGRLPGGNRFAGSAGGHR